MEDRPTCKIENLKKFPRPGINKDCPLAIYAHNCGGMFCECKSLTECWNFWKEKPILFTELQGAYNKCCDEIYKKYSSSIENSKRWNITTVVLELYGVIDYKGNPISITLIVYPQMILLDVMKTLYSRIKLLECSISIIHHGFRII